MVRERIREVGDGIWGTLKQIAHYWGLYECTSVAAAVAFYAAVSLFPLLMVLIASVGLFFEFQESSEDARERVLAAVGEQVSPELSEGLGQILEGVQEKAWVSGPIAAAGFLFVALLGFAQVDRGLDRTWGVHRRRPPGMWNSVRHLLTNRLRSLGLLFGLGAMVLVVFVGGTAVYAVEGFLGRWVPEVDGIYDFGHVGLAFSLNMLTFGAVYRFLSKGPVRWGDCLVSGFFAAFLWEVGRGILGEIVIGERYTAYGVVGSFLAVLLWIYYGAMVLFIGAILVRVEVEQREAAEEAAK
ncbi:MAG: YihY/virulence factor BrkB family protein [Verrucomicrobiales bacterium]